MEPFLSKAIDIAKEAGEVLKHYWGKLSYIEQKRFPWDLVTEADKESEAVILNRLSTAFPSHAILSEESGTHSSQEKSPYCWVVDPLDGTTNYTHQYPWVSISIALLQDKAPIMGVVYNPIMGELFYTEIHKGAFLNNVPITVSQVNSLSLSLLATGFAYDRKENAENNYAEFCHMTHQSQGVRRGGSAALDLAYVAAGRLDGYWERGLNPWDIAAGILLIQEAGGKVTSYEGDPVDLYSGRLLASNGILHEVLIQELGSSKEV